MGLIGGMARTAVIAGTATAVGNRVSRRQANRWSKKDQSAYADDPYAQPQYAQPQYAQPQYAPQPQYVQPQYAPPQYVQPQYVAPAAPAPPPAAPAPDKYEQLRKLGEFHDQGILTDQEFAEQKARILAT
jgi:Short C-terminal domain